MRLPKGTKTLFSYLLFVFGLQWENVCAFSEDICEGKHMIKCKNKACVPASFKCDGEDDCGDNSDETDCKNNNSTKVQCGPEDFVCSNDRCIRHSYVCDGEDDCADNSDERNCTKKIVPYAKCNNVTNFQCKNGRCIPRLYTCDKVDDCGDKSDESKTDGPKCSEQAISCPGNKMFRCKKSGFCISKLRVCDGNNDCGSDTSDEENCSSHPCLPGQLKCGNGICISKIWKCNGIDDCGDQSDEKNCTSSCSKSEFKCRTSTKCIVSSARCDGRKDCHDGSDEELCNHVIPSAESVVTKTCLESEYRCSTNRLCIQKSWLCDGTTDCPNKEDETPKVCLAQKCKSSEFQCSNGQCTPKRYHCDGVSDCFDKSDEANCSITREFKCSKDTIKCKNSDKCIHPSQLCDSMLNCPHGDDEGPKCGINECLTKDHKCSHGCQDLPIGHVCTCPNGYKLASNKAKCVDINECKEFGRCTQACVNYEGSFACLCDEGFTLDVGDKKTCRALAPKPYLLFANDFDIREVSLSGDDYKPILSIWSSIIALAVDTRDQMIYWADNYNKTIARAPMNDPLKMEVILKTDVKMLKGLDIDWIGRKLYWTDSTLNTINVADLNGLNRKVLARGGPREEFRGIAVHPEKGYIFWTNWVHTHSKIERANLDGSDRRTIVSTGIVWVSGIAVDYQLNRLYWSDRFHRHISSSTIHGGDVRKIVTNLHKPTGLAIFEDKVYWLDSDEKKLSRANKFTGRTRTEYKENLISPMDLVIYHPSAQKKVSHPCDDSNGGCSHLCFMTPETKRSMCGCPDNLYLGPDRKTCGDVPYDVTVKCVGGHCVETARVDMSRIRIRSTQREFYVAYIVGGVLILLCIMAIFVVIVVYKRRRNQFGLSILYETDTDLVFSNNKNNIKKPIYKKNMYNTEATTTHDPMSSDTSPTLASDSTSSYVPSRRRFFLTRPDFLTKMRCSRNAVLSFDNINFKPFTNMERDDPGIHNIPAGFDAADLVMDECPIDDDRQPIIAHMV